MFVVARAAKQHLGHSTPATLSALFHYILRAADTIPWFATSIPIFCYGAVFRLTQPVPGEPMFSIVHGVYAIFGHTRVVQHFFTPRQNFVVF